MATGRARGQAVRFRLRRQPEAELVVDQAEEWADLLARFRTATPPGAKRAVYLRRRDARRRQAEAARQTPPAAVREESRTGGTHAA
jgi:hypothetical protein